jgi:predicted transcriptional regulator
MIKNVGPLEQKVLAILWQNQEATARDICSSLEEQGERRAYSTIRTIINRLVKKKIVSQRLDVTERIYIYAPIYTKSELEKRIIHGLLGDMLKKFEQSTINYLAEELSENEEEIERIKQKLVEMKKYD